MHALRDTVRAGTVAFAAAPGLAAAASPATAGGIAPIASPAFDTTCTTLSHTVSATGITAYTPGVLSNVLQMPVDRPYQHCGSADLFDLSHSFNHDNIDI
ncbi:chaplin family protein [Kitasatospora sp. NPDC101157]|uniref:chaplin family protein n=1 Tax=Kitasatospora sp. NPDC101157 TaxID=3364098 RepID=UPI0038109790